MNEFLSNLLIAVITAAVPVLTTYGVKLIRKMAENIEDTRVQGYAVEISSAVCDAVSATSQTYVDSLKSKGEFTREAQKQAAQKALAVCVASLTPATKKFIEQAYGDLNSYLANKIEAEVRSQKQGLTTLSA